jgi:Fe-Mn family superoxide dismutase
VNIPLNRLILPPLPYYYDALEPLISAEAMRIHYEGHHKNYVDTFNKLLDRLEHVPIMKPLFRESFPGEHGVSPTSLEFNFFGHILHSHYWNSISPRRSSWPGPTTEAALSRSYLSLDGPGSFLIDLSQAAQSIKGSGWVVVVPSDCKRYIDVQTIENHNPLEARTTWSREAIRSETGKKPLLVFDAWEHAYYLDYQNKKGSFFKDLGEFINWDALEDGLSS